MIKLFYIVMTFDELLLYCMIKLHCFKMLLSDDGLKSKTASQKITSQRKESLQIFLNLINNGDENLNIFELPLISYSSCLKKNKETS